MLSAAELHSIKNGGCLTQAMQQNKDDLSLKSKIYAIEYERRQSLKTMEIRRRQFLHQYHQTAVKRSVPLSVLVERKKRKVEDGKKEERRSKSVLDNRTSEFIDGLKTRPLTTGITRKTLLQKLQEQEKPHMTDFGEKKLPENETKSGAMGLYQRSFGLIKNHSENSNPFVASVGSIIKRLKGGKSGENQDGEREKPVNELTRKIFGKYFNGQTTDGADVEESGTATLKEGNSVLVSKSESETCNSDNDPCGDQVKQSANKDKLLISDSLTQGQHGNCRDTNGGTKSDSDSDSSIKAMTAKQDESTHTYFINRGRSQSKTISKHDTPQMSLPTNEKTKGKKDLISINIIPPHVKSHDSSTKYVTAERTSRPEKNHVFREKTGLSDSPEDADAILFPHGSHESRGGGVNVSGPQNGASHHHVGTEQHRVQHVNSRKNTRSSVGSLQFRRSSSLGPYCSKQREESTGDRNRRPQTRSKSPEIPVVNRSQTIIIVHSESGTEQEKHSIFGNQKNTTSQNGDEEGNVKSKEQFGGDKSSFVHSLNGTGHSTDNNSNHYGKDGEEEDNDDDNVDNAGDNKIPPLYLVSPSPEETTTDSVSVEGSKLSRADSFSRTVGRRRLSMQTTGALRLWAEVQKLDEERERKLVQSEEQKYGQLVENLAAAESEATEQAERLKAVRRFPPGLSMPGSAEQSPGGTAADPNTIRGSTTARRMSRQEGAIHVTDEVYKFVRRRYSVSDIRHALWVRPDQQKPAKADFLVNSSSSSNVGNNTARRNSVTASQNSERIGSATGRSRIPSAKGRPSESRKGKSLLSAVFRPLEGTPRRRSVPESKDKSRETVREIITSAGSGRTESKNGNRVPSASANRRDARSYSWAPDVSQPKKWHILALELLSRNQKGLSKFRTVSHLLQCLKEEYERERTDMVFEELRYCTYLRLPKAHVPLELQDCDVTSIFSKE
ncbi:uncharacterized protein LOC101856958 [Aplysia californica]|uniref:Uncharacterized protein LOC101856958 n=1 Tax=Aplysia californica TaxID=6500 RepID=A0ABM0ZWQ0_APLCA|nr:uncharacterized protein LOC101856958 [Aplysia californica]